MTEMLMLAWVVMLCGFMGRNEHSERTNCLALKMETVCSSKMLVSTYKSTRYYTPEYRQDSTFLPYTTKPLKPEELHLQNDNLLEYCTQQASQKYTDRSELRIASIITGTYL
jgi:hypothetical protein